ncbi:hypothetical protein Btru_032936 [Bulinus truncatus]|nr:hypothetical protein Btru_032936 [Bulinus truncatus]
MQFDDMKMYDSSVRVITNTTISGVNSTAENQSDSLSYDDRMDYYYNNLDDLKQTRFWVLNQIQKYYIPGLCLLGLLGNLSSAAIFMTRLMRVKSCVNYLLFKCITDTFFLVSLFVVWLDRVEIRWFHHQGVCQLIVFMTYVSGFMSVWMVVMVTLENYVSICHPQRVGRICTPRKAHVISLALFMFSVLCYNFPIWTTASQENASQNKCTHDTGYSQINEGLAYFDTALTLVLPFFLVFAFMYNILKTMIQAFLKIRRRRNLANKCCGAISPITDYSEQVLGAISPITDYSEQVMWGYKPNYRLHRTSDCEAISPITDYSELVTVRLKAQLPTTSN